MITHALPLYHKFLIEDKEFFIFKKNTYSEDLYDITLHKQRFFYKYYVDFLKEEHIESYKQNFLLEYQNFKDSNKSKKLLFYKIIISENSNKENYKDFIDFINMHKLHVTLIVLSPVTGETTLIFNNFKDKENLSDFISDVKTRIAAFPPQVINLSTIENETKKKAGYFLEDIKPVLTKYIIVLNVLFFIILTLAGGSQNIDVLIKYGAKFNPAIAQGEYYRFIFSMFMHIGVFHLFFNCYALHILGKDIEIIFGKLHFSIIYLFAGIFGSVGSYIFNDSVSAGASGAIFGIIGAYIYFGIKKPEIYSFRYGMNILVLLGINIFLGLTNSSIDNMAHLFGFIGGLLASFAIGTSKEKIFSKKKISLQILALFILTALIFSGNTVNQNKWQYNYYLGVQYASTENYPEAKNEFLKSLEKSPNNPDLYYYVALISYIEGDSYESKTFLMKALEIDPAHIDARALLAEIN